MSTVSAETANNAVQEKDWAQLMGINPGQAIQEIGWDEDSDSTISESVEKFLGSALLDEDANEIVDSVLLWWRSDDGDLVDGLVDATRNLDDGGSIWVLTPVGDMNPGEVAEAAKLAGMVQTASSRMNTWQGVRFVTPNTRK